MYIVSCRKKFWSNSRIRAERKPDKVAKVDRHGIETRKTMADYEAKIENKKVLLLCHGYNNPRDSVIGAYDLIKRNHKAFVNYFDVVVGYTWPGGGNFTTYPGARGRTSAVAARFRELLKATIPKCSELAVMSHSMGCRISLIAHTQLHRKGIRKANKHWQYLMAPAVDDESIERDEKYEPATLYCDNTYVFHSTHDRVVCEGYELGEGASGGGRDPALGCGGPESPAAISGKSKIINCKSIIIGRRAHGKYKSQKPIYDYICNELKGTPAPQFSQLH